MKFIKSIILCGICLMGLSLTSCDKWLDVNVDPENPSDMTATYEARLPHIQFYTNSATQFANWRTSMSMGDWTRFSSNGSTYYHMSYWNPQTGAVTTAYQWWFVGAACNIKGLLPTAARCLPAAVPRAVRSSLRKRLLSWATTVNNRSLRNGSPCGAND